MDDKEISGFYERLYWHDIDARECLNNRVQIPLAMIVALAGLLGFMLQSYDHKTFTLPTGIFVGLVVLASISLVAATALVITSTYRHQYSFLPPAKVIEDHRVDLQNYHAAHPSAAGNAAEAFALYLRGRYIEYSSINTARNDVRSAKLHQANTAIISAAAFLFVAFLVFYLGRLDKNGEDKTARVMITSPVSIKGVVMTQQNPVPPPPPPPPARLVRDDGGRGKAPVPQPQPVERK